MRLRRLGGLPSCSILIVTLAVLIMSGATLLHWHKDWSDQGCQLCHVRDLPTLYSAFTVIQANPPASHQDWHPENCGEELDTWIGITSTRGPPAPSSFAV